ncbi:hypothetical protein FSP39_005234 [Pinctada imbricata]|uniref:Uncharacterized protein n=1 Tax=Pinctada imbricata TaxID=66713 RepID=A0AA88YLP6_PINIB|nr:hypothetical protein FSP39_005234 [Pinctada imbricata]
MMSIGQSRLRRDSKPTPPESGENKKTRTVSPGIISGLKPFSLVVKQSLNQSVCEDDTLLHVKGTDLGECSPAEQGQSDQGDHAAVTGQDPEQSQSLLVSLAEEDMQTISNSVCQYIMENIGTIMSPLLAQLSNDLKEAVRSSGEEIVQLRAENVTLRNKVDELEQRSRRNNVRISGIKEAPGVEEDGQLISIVKKDLSVTGISIQDSDIDDVYRAGEKRPGRTRPIVVRFTNHITKAKVSSFESRKKLPKGVYVNDDLTRTRSNLLYRARCLVKTRALEKAWSANGNVFVRDLRGTKHRIDNEDALDLIKNCSG